jgi:gamma-glutamyltranspeptidase/glutathione hydrolase
MRFTALLLLLVPLCALADTAAPEAASGFHTRPAVYSRHSMVSTANPYASQAARDILRRGGSAIDAAIAAQLVLGLTEPQSSGIGGGAFMLYFDGRKLTSFDGRETAPATAEANCFCKTMASRWILPRCGGWPLGWRTRRGGHAETGASARWQALWASLFQPAIALARNGFAVSPRLHALLGTERFLQQDPQARAYFYQADGSPLPVGSLLKNPDYATTLELLANKARQRFIREKSAGRLSMPSTITRLTPAACWRQTWRPTRPSSANRCAAPIAAGRCAAWMHSGGGPYCRCWAYCSASRCPPCRPPAATPSTCLPKQTSWPLPTATATWLTRLCHRPQSGPDRRDYLQQRSRLIDPARSMGRATAGNPPASLSRYGRDNAPEWPSTSHFNIVDRAGRVVSMTSSIEDQFGSRLLVKGFCSTTS